MSEESDFVRRQSAASGRVDYSRPVAIRQGQSTHLEVLCSYIPRRTSSGRLSLKLLYWKTAKGQYAPGYPAEFTLNHDEAIKLRDEINRGLAVASQQEAGDYLVVKMGEQQIVADERDKAALGRTLASALSEPDVLDALGSDHEGRVVLGVMQVAARLAQLSQAIADLEKALTTRGDERYYQDWCEEHSWAFGNAYTMRDDVRTIAIGDQVDLLMKQTANGLRDIYELKVPTRDALIWDSSHKSYHWSAEASKSIGQCHRYIDALHDEARSGLRDSPHVVAYHPRAFIVLGRSLDWDDTKLRALHGLNTRLHGVQIMTYDQLLAQAKQVLVVLSVSSESQVADDTGSDVDHWGEPPF